MSETPELTVEAARRMWNDIMEAPKTAVERARAKGWSVDPGLLRESGPLDWLAQENNENARRRR